MMPGLTVFTWGYAGWGNQTRSFVRVADAVERKHGFVPPRFFDIRARRSVRATGFNGDAFRRTVGADRYRWIRALGNESVLDGGRGIRVRDPEATEYLLDLVLSAYAERQRAILFCHCEWPREDGKPCCHRAIVGDLLLRTARKRGVRLTVVEWPGGIPDRGVPPTLNVRSDVLDKVRKGAKWVPLAAEIERVLPPRRESSNALWSGWSGLPCYSRVTLKSASDSLTILSGPARKRGRWSLPVWWPEKGAALSQRGLAADAAADRRFYGYEPRRSW